MFQIYINNRDKQVVPSPHMPKALVERLNLRRPNRFSIQSVASNGQKSHVTDVLFEDVLPEPRPGRELAGQGDASSVVSSSQNEDGERRVVHTFVLFVSPTIGVASCLRESARKLCIW